LNVTNNREVAMKPIIMFAMVLSLCSCVFGGDGRKGDGGDASISVPVSVPVSVTKYGQICRTDHGSCPMMSPLVEGSLCYCPSFFGPVYGKVVQ